MDLSVITLSWFDLAAVTLIVVGIFHGRKNGMSQELFNTMKWLAMLTISAAIYLPIGELILRFVPIAPIYGYISAYILANVALTAILVTVRKKIKDKMSGSDVFGRAEFPLGMVAGAFQYACMLVMFMAVLNAKYVDEEALERQDARQKKALGENFFPSPGNIHKDVLYGSIAGQTVRDFLSTQLMRQVNPPKKK